MKVYKLPDRFSLEPLAPILKKQGSKTKHCEHCIAPKERRIWADSQSMKGVEQKTLLLWMMRTTYDQVIFTHFKRHSSEWLKYTDGGVPLPICGAGMGCVRVEGPEHFIAEGLVKPEWVADLSPKDGAFIYLLATGCRSIMGRIGLDYREVFECIKSEGYPEWVVRLFEVKEIVCIKKY